MDTMNWAEQICQAMLQTATPLLIRGALLTVSVTTLAWLVASVIYRAENDLRFAMSGRGRQAGIV